MYSIGQGKTYLVFPDGRALYAGMEQYEQFSKEI